jgi:ketosteroid isomerase-like protein
MSQENIDKLRRGYESFNRGEFDAAVALMHRDVEFFPQGDQAPYRGAEKLRAWMEPDAFEMQLFEPRAFTVAGNKVLVEQHTKARGAGSGIEYEAGSWVVWTFDEEGLVIRMEGFLEHEKAKALGAAGLSELPMSQQNVEVVCAMIDAVNRGDWDATIKDAAPDFVWDNSRAIGTDNRVVLTSAEQARDFFKELNEIWESFRIEINETIPIGDHVVVPHTGHVRGRGGIEVHARTTWLFTIHDGKIERVCLYQDKQEALDAAGLSE